MSHNSKYYRKQLKKKDDKTVLGSRSLKDFFWPTAQNKPSTSAPKIEGKDQGNSKLQMLFLSKKAVPRLMIKHQLNQQDMECHHHHRGIQHQWILTTNQLLSQRSFQCKLALKQLLLQHSQQCSGFRIPRAAP
ncbi:hypothetical protein DPMN_177962 [Dreissena polymorpha]|uniref:Uncharacterized protein n=1 Tax=Dreissena polymorpha TaxID=45954 RepID=A0A9D4ECI7_DREPO|nr:hypothetical protein DPMN_177962 [Dreissena polymorpha]